jgi:O-antigen ligase
MELKHMQMSQGERSNYQIGFIFLLLFCALRPLTLLDLKISIAEYNVMELFAVIMSYLLLLPIFLNLRKIKFDFISISILWFCLYCLLSLIWGSQLKTVAQVTLPFILFFAIRVIINEPKQIKLLITVLIIAYCFPLVGSFYQIIKGFTVAHVEYITGIERYAGMFKKLLIFSYAMFFLSVLFYIQVIINQLKNRKVKWALLFLLIISFFCLYKTYARTAYIGLAIFWGISLFGYNKKYFFIMLISLLIIGILYISTLQQIFFKTQVFDVDTALSGRMVLWEHNINFFLESNFDRKLLGHGFGRGATGVFGSKNQIWASHNDYLEILLSAGGFGLLLYLIIPFILMKDVYMSIVAKSTKYFYYGIIVSITFMSFVTGILLYQVGVSQQFWMIMGFFYVFRDFKEASPHGV